MSHFLRHLLQRALPAVSSGTLRPRLPARFENGRAPAAFTEEQIATTPATPRVTAFEPTDPPAAPTSAPSAHALTEKTGAPAPSWIGPNPVMPPSPFPSLLGTSSQPRPVATLSVPPPAYPVEVRRSLPFSPAATLLVERKGERVYERTKEPAARESSAAAPPPGSVTPALPVALRSVSPQAGSTLPEVSPAPPAETDGRSIRVTIGRVEIRAVSSASSPTSAATRAQSVHSPVVSLENYLAKRNSS